jgi:hypothetical protein
MQGNLITMLLENVKSKKTGTQLALEIGLQKHASMLPVDPIETEVPDIVFAFADVMQHDKKANYKLFESNQLLHPDQMYEKIIDSINKTKKKLVVRKVPLNFMELPKILSQKAKVVFLLCHGDI